MINELQAQLSQAKNSDAKWWVSNVLAKHQDRVSLGEAEHILDYFDSVPNKRLKRMSLDVAIKQAKDWVERLKKKGRSVPETEADVEVFMTFGNGTRIVKLKSEASYMREGALMSHCVGSYYGKNVDVYSLRDINNNPHCTIEVTKSDVNQIKGKGNGSIHPKYIQFVLLFLDKIGKSVRSSEMRYLGYIELSKETWAILADVKGVKELTYGGKRYLYIHSKIKTK